MVEIRLRSLDQHRATAYAPYAKWLAIQAISGHRSDSSNVCFLMITAVSMRDHLYLDNL